MEKLHYLVNILKRDLIERGESNIGVSYRDNSIEVEIEKVNYIKLNSGETELNYKPYNCYLKIERFNKRPIENIIRLCDCEMEGFFKEVSKYMTDIFNEK